MQNKDIKNFIHSELCDFKDVILDVINKKFEQVNQKFEQVNQKFEQVNQKFEQVNQKFEQVNQKFEQVNQKFEQVNEELEQIHNKFEQIDNKIKQMDSDLKSLTNTVTLIEHNHGEKLAALMDYIVVNNDKHNKYDNNFKNINDIIQNHSMRIDEIEKSINY